MEKPPRTSQGLMPANSVSWGSTLGSKGGSRVWIRAEFTLSLYPSLTYKGTRVGDEVEKETFHDKRFINAEPRKTCFTLLSHAWPPLTRTRRRQEMHQVSRHEWTLSSSHSLRGPCLLDKSGGQWSFVSSHASCEPFQICHVKLFEAESRHHWDEWDFPKWFANPELPRHNAIKCILR